MPPKARPMRRGRALPPRRARVWRGTRRRRTRPWPRPRVPSRMSCHFQWPSPMRSGEGGRASTGQTRSAKRFMPVTPRLRPGAQRRSPVSVGPRSYAPHAQLPSRPWCLTAADMSIVITGASGQLGRLVTAAVLDGADAGRRRTRHARPLAAGRPRAARRRGARRRLRRSGLAFAARSRGPTKALIISTDQVGARVAGHKAAIDAAAAGRRGARSPTRPAVNPSHSNPIVVTSEHRETEEHLRASGAGLDDAAQQHLRGDAAPERRPGAGQRPARPQRGRRARLLRGASGLCGGGRRGAHVRRARREAVRRHGPRS